MKKRTITERENVLRVLRHSGNPEWVPVSDDCFQIVVPCVVRERPPFGTDGMDWFGCNWIFDSSTNGHAPDVKNPPMLEDITEWRDVVKFPDLDSIDWESAAKKDLEDFDRDEKLMRIFFESGPFERSHHLMGFENAFIAMSTEPEEYKALIDAVADYKVKLINKLITYYKPDEFFAHDDLGTAHGPMISLDMYRKLLKPAHKRISEAIRLGGAVHTHHSCGRMESFIDELIDNGAQMINPVQTVNNRSEVAEKYSGAVCFEVGTDMGGGYPDAKEEDIRQEVRDIIDTFAPGKNLVFCSYVSVAKCYGRNRDIILDEARKYGREFYK